MELSIPSTCGLLVYQVGHKRTSWPSETKSIVADLVSTKLILFFSGGGGSSSLTKSYLVFIASWAKGGRDWACRVTYTPRQTDFFWLYSADRLFANDLFDFFPPIISTLGFIAFISESRSEKNRQLSFFLQKKSINKSPGPMDYRSTFEKGNFHQRRG